MKRNDEKKGLAKIVGGVASVQACCFGLARVWGFDLTCRLTFFIIRKENMKKSMASVNNRGPTVAVLATAASDSDAVFGA